MIKTIRGSIASVTVVKPGYVTVKIVKSAAAPSEFNKVSENWQDPLFIPIKAMTVAVVCAVYVRLYALLAGRPAIPPMHGLSIS